jgi:hypothetical protein
MKISEKPRLVRATPLRGKYAIDVAIGSYHVIGFADDSGQAIADLVKNVLQCAEEIARGNQGTIDHGVSRPEAEKLVRGIVQAAIEMACLRHDLCLETGPPVVQEQCAEIVADTFNALHGVDTCLHEPAPEVADLYRVLGVQPKGLVKP